MKTNVKLCSIFLVFSMCTFFDFPSSFSLVLVKYLSAHVSQISVKFHIGFILNFPRVFFKYRTNFTRVFLKLLSHLPPLTVNFFKVTSAYSSQICLACLRTPFELRIHFSYIFFRNLFQIFFTFLSYFLVFPFNFRNFFHISPVLLF